MSGSDSESSEIRMKFGLTPPVPISRLTAACEQIVESGWEIDQVVLFPGVAARSRVVSSAGNQRPGEPCYCILTRTVVVDGEEPAKIELRI